MALALEQQSAQPQASSLGFEERLGLLVDREWTHRDSRRIERLLKQAKLKNAHSVYRGYRLSRGARLG